MFFTEDETRHIIRSLADAIVYLHKRGNNVLQIDILIVHITFTVLENLFFMTSSDFSPHPACDVDVYILKLLLVCLQV